MSNDPAHRRATPKPRHHPRLQRGSVSGTFPAERAYGLADALRDALEELEAERLHTTRRGNQADDDEDPTRRGQPGS
jgi:hypothetical protein